MKPPALLGDAVAVNSRIPEPSVPKYVQGQYNCGMAKEEKCIYCSTSFDSAVGEGDHILPVQLGEFREAVQFRRICPGCNNRIGKSEQQFLRCGPESLFRSKVKPTVPPKRQRGCSSRAGAAMGAPGPRFTIERDDHYEIVRPSSENPENCFPVDQLVIQDIEGKEFHIPLFPGMLPKQLRDRTKKTGVRQIKKAWLHSDESKWEEHQKLLIATWPQVDVQELPSTEIGIHQVQTVGKFIVNDHYFRALAKIGFHYYLIHTRRGLRGDEEGFAHIRDFIMNGGKIEPFFEQKQQQFTTPVGEQPSGGLVSPRQWCHILGADESGLVATAYIHLFLGPGCVPPPYSVNLGRHGSSLTRPGFVWGHFYLYDDPQSDKRKAGRVVAASILNIPRGNTAG